MSKHYAKAFAAAIAAVVAVLAFASTALATTPAPGYEGFAGCPSPSENPVVTFCLRTTVTSGHFNMGNKEVPITAPIVISGGIGEETPLIYNSKGGMPPVKEKVPGGVIGLTGLTWLLEFLGSEALTLYAATELAGSVKPGVTEESLPIKVHLINSVLGSHCYIGSNSNPINLNLTTGTTSPPPPNEPISGSGPKLHFDEATGILNADGTYVDNSFAAPGANGCVLTLFGFIPISINGLVNSASGLPAAAGTNETVQVLHSELVESSRVYP